MDKNAFTSPRIEDYGLIGDGRTAALVSRYGSIDWCCFPRFDSPSYFAALLDCDIGGFFSIQPIEPYRSSQKYIPDTNVLETEFVTTNGIVRVRDCFAACSEKNKRNHFWPDQEILRVIEAEQGEMNLRMTFHPQPDYANPACRMRIDRCGKLGWFCTSQQDLLVLNSSLTEESIQRDQSGLRADFAVRAGQRVIFSLIHTDVAPAVIPPLGDQAVTRLEQTIAYWKDWIAHCRYRGPNEAEVRRSALALRLLVFAPSGAIVASPTTSLPEAPGGERNWDYRYSWLRDASFTVRALIDLGFYEEAKSFVSWMLHSTRLTRPKLQALYAVYGEAHVDEQTIPWLSGYHGAKPVRIGNAAHGQFQLDIYGEVLGGFFQLVPLLEKIDRETRDFILSIGSAIQQSWNQPDDGIWEFRNGRAHHTHSKVLACVGLERLLQLCERFQWRAPTSDWRTTAELLREQIESRGFNTGLQSYVRTLDGTAIDASLLVLPLVGYCDARSTRMKSTCAAVVRELADGPWIYRYRDRPDHQPVRDGCFGICSFWYVENLARRGELAKARKWLEQIYQRRNSVGLWSEMIQPRTGQFLGNYPQGFTHIGLVNAAVSLERAAQQFQAVA